MLGMGRFFFNSVPVTILLKKEGKNFEIVFQGTNYKNYPIFSDYGEESKEGAYPLLSEQFIKRNSFTFDSAKIDGIKDVITNLTNDKIKAQKSRFSWGSEDSFIKNEKQRLKDAVDSLKNYLKENVFDPIQKDIYGRDINQILDVKGASLGVVTSKGKSVQLPGQTLPVALTLDLAQDNLMTRPWRSVYWRIYAFCKELGIAIPTITTWATTFSSGLKATALVAGLAGLGYLARLEYQQPGTIGGALSSAAQRTGEFATKVAPKQSTLTKDLAGLESMPFEPTSALTPVAPATPPAAPAATE